MQDYILMNDVELAELNSNTAIIYSERDLSFCFELCEQHIKIIEKSHPIDIALQVLMQVLTSSEVSAEFQKNPSVLLLKNYVTQIEECRLLLKEKMKAMLIQQYNTLENSFFRLMAAYVNADNMGELFFGWQREEYKYYQIAAMIIKEFTKEFISEFDITRTIKVGEKYPTAMEFLAWESKWEMIKFIADRKPTNKADSARYCIALAAAALFHGPNEVIESLIKALVKANASLDVDILGNTGDEPNISSYSRDGKKERWVERTTAISSLIDGYSYLLERLTTEEVALLKELLGSSFWKLKEINVEDERKKYRMIKFSNKEISWIKQMLKATGRQDAKELCEKLIENKDMVKLLLEGGANITFRDLMRRTPIDKAATYHDFEMVELIASLRNTDEEDKAHFRFALVLAFEYPEHKEMTEKFLEDLVEERVKAIIALLKAGTPTQQVFSSKRNFTELLIYCGNTKLLTEMAELLKRVNFDFKYDNSGILESLLNECKDSYLAAQETQAATPFWVLPPSNSTTTATTTATKEREEQRNNLRL